MSAAPLLKPARQTRRVRHVRINLALTAICFLMLFPVLSTFILSLKQQSDVRRQPPILFPCDTPVHSFDLTACRFFLEGYDRVFLSQPDPGSVVGLKLTGRILSTYLPNTILYATVTAICVTGISALAAYAFSRYRFRGRRALMIGLLMLAGVPVLTMLLAMQQIGNTIRHTFPGYDERLFMIVVYIGFELPFAIWVVKGFFDTIPRDLEEAASIDGCSRFGVLMRIVAPLATPGLVSIFLLAFVNVWNDFIANYLLMSKQNLRGAIYGVYDYIAQSLSSYNALAAACILVMLPVIVVFLFTRRVFFRAMIEGAIKG